ncbi:AN1-type domain-containing protein [Fusarium keratoplasticum]|nr:AN1-type domain-containing protein [Fusarium keratoplasticum]
MFPYWACAVAGCPNAAAIDIGGCERCQSMYCSHHVDSIHHTCEDTPLDSDELIAAKTAELTALSNKINHGALVRLATELSRGKPCQLNDQDPMGCHMMGDRHIHLQLIFEDGTVWLARIPRETYRSFDNQLSNEILASECATLRWLESVDVPAPRLHGYGLYDDPQNKVGVAFMLIDKMPGRPFNSLSASKEQKTKVLGQWADILCTLSSHPFQESGSLRFDNDGTIKVGPMASDKTAMLPCMGPFQHAKDLYSSWAIAYLRIITEGQIFSDFALDAYIMFKYILRQVKTGPWLDRWRDLNSGPFFLKYPDDEGSHVLVDDEFQITGVIDWTFARIVPAFETFGPSLISADNDDLFFGEVGLTNEDMILGLELQCRGSPFCFFQSDEIRRLLFGLGMAMSFVHDEAIGAFQGLVATFEGRPLDWDKWWHASLIEWKDDPFVSAHSQEISTRLLNSIPEVPRFASCSYLYCTRSSVRGRRCHSCWNDLCAIHILPRYHLCLLDNYMLDDDEETEAHMEVEALLTQVNAYQLLRVASSLRHGKRCMFFPGNYIGRGSMMGSSNYHVWILFEDRVTWLARIPRDATFADTPSDLTEYIVESEYATLKWLGGLTLPTPRAHGYGLASDPENLVGVSYILEDAMPGQPFNPRLATDQQKTHVYNQYARILIEISSHPRTQAFSFVPRDGMMKQGPIASNRDRTIEKHGPFHTSRDYFTSTAEHQLRLIADGQLYPEYPKEAFVFYRMLRDRVAPILATPSRIGGFYLKHADDIGDHLLVDKNYNITAVIDWQYARFVPPREAFGPSLFTANLGNLHRGVAGLCADDKLLSTCLRRQGRADLADLARGSELSRRFHLGLSSGLEKPEISRLIRAVLCLLDGREAPRSGVRAWVEQEWACAVGDPWREKTMKLVQDIERAKLEEA